jgi:surface polysaccharide O-acyltransferase-like enzyme
VSFTPSGRPDENRKQAITSIIAVAPDRETAPAPDPARLLYGDLMRVCGAVAVVVLHAAAGGVVRVADLSPAHWWLYNTLDSACRWAVPIFVMLSGAVLLPARDSESLQTYYTKRVTRIGLPLLFWSGFYLAVTSVGVPPARAATRALVAIASGNPYFHLYFLFVLLGLSVFVPVFRAAARALRERHLIAFAAIALAMAGGDAIFRAFVGARPNAMSLFVPYIGYFFLGFVLRHTVLSRPAENACRVVLALSVALTAVGTGIAVSRWGLAGPSLFLYDALSPTVIPMSVSLFLLFTTAASRPGNRRWFTRPGLALLSPATMGVYLLHPYFLLLLLRSGVVAGTVAPWLHLTVSVLTTLAASLLVTLLLQRLGPLRRLIG